MKYRLNGFLVSPNETGKDIGRRLSQTIGIPETKFRFDWLKRRSVLVQNKIMLEYDFVIDTHELFHNRTMNFLVEQESFVLPEYQGKGRPVVVGAGFAGLFAAYLLAKSGASPIVLEQGEELSERVLTQRYFESRLVLNDASNYAFGEGGRSSSQGGYISFDEEDSKERYLLSCFAELGLSMPSEKEAFRFVDREMVCNAFSIMKRKISESGGLFLFGASFLSIDRFLGWPKGVTYFQDGSKKSIKASSVILATGNSLRSLSLAEKNRIHLEREPARLGFFIEMNGRDYESAYYGRGKTGSLPPLFVKDNFVTSNKRKVGFEFGYSNADIIQMGVSSSYVDLGLSLGQWNGSGSAIGIVSIELTEEERKSLSSAGKFGNCELLLGECNKRNRPFAIPAESIGDFVNKKEPMVLSYTRTAYKGSLVLSNFHDILPKNLAETLSFALFQIGRKYPLFAKPSNLLIGFTTLNSRPFYAQNAISGLRGVANALPHDGDGMNLLKCAYRALDAVISILQEG